MSTDQRGAMHDQTAERGAIDPADICLDGAVLGRWVMRYLEQQVIRPHGGITAVDPRLTPTWAGPPTGM